MAPNEAVARHPHRERWQDMGKRYRQYWHRAPEDEEPEPPYQPPNPSTCNVQVVRSVSDWSHGVLTEHSIQNACTLFGPQTVSSGLALTCL